MNLCLVIIDLLILRPQIYIKVALTYRFFCEMIVFGDEKVKSEE